MTGPAHRDAALVRRGVVEVDGEILLDALFPGQERGSLELLSVSYDAARDRVALLIDGPALPEQECGKRAMVQAILTRHDGPETGPVVRIETRFERDPH